MSSDEQIEQTLQARSTAPRVTLDDIHALIAREEYWRPEGTTLTVCVLHLQNGFTVTGESAAASPENFDEAIGRKLAFTRARDGIWPLAGYLLKQKLWEEENTPKVDVMSIPAELIAKVCHEVNRAYCASIGDDSQPPWAEAPKWQQDSALAGVHMHLENPDATPEDSHRSWLKVKEAEGWVYGEVKDPAKKEHPCMVPYDQLPIEQRAKDYLFRSVVHAMAD